MNRYLNSLGFLIAIVLASAWTFSNDAPQEAIAQEESQESIRDDAATAIHAEVTQLKEEISRLKDKAPDQAHSMTDVDYHFANLWFAGKAENWPLAEFYWKETVSHMKWAARIIPVRKDNAGKEIKLEAILESILQSPWMQVGKTIEQQDVAQFEKAYKFTLGGCYNCHKASDKPYLRPQVPERPASSMINFDPKATWPQ